jgi:hypothetical protein
MTPQARRRPDRSYFRVAATRHMGGAHGRPNRFFPIGRACLEALFVAPSRDAPRLQIRRQPLGNGPIRM